jgi:imidazole glycerol-phosphate synthase subunit HisH
LIAIIDYGLGNLRSIQNMLRRLGAESQISGDPNVFNSASKLILPGVGHFAFAMSRLRTLGLIGALNDLVIGQGKPVLGICLGAQLLGRHSEEGNCEGLDWVPMKTVAFNREKMPSQLKVPHMGWSETVPRKLPLFAEITGCPRFYYVHSFHFSCDDESSVLCTAHHGYEFPSGIHYRNIIGVQFHPEKSHLYGMRLLSNFINLERDACVASE